MQAGPLFVLKLLRGGVAVARAYPGPHAPATLSSSLGQRRRRGDGTAEEEEEEPLARFCGHEAQKAKQAKQFRPAPRDFPAPETFDFGALAIGSAESELPIRKPRLRKDDWAPVVL